MKHSFYVCLPYLDSNMRGENLSICLSCVDSNGMVKWSLVCPSICLTRISIWGVKWFVVCPSVLCGFQYEVMWIGSFASQLTIFQSYNRRHIDVQANWRRSWTYGRTPNAIDILQGSLTCPSKYRHGTNLFIRWFRHTAQISRLLRYAWGYGGHILDLTPGPSRGGGGSNMRDEM